MVKIPERVVCFITAVRGHHEMPAAASTASPFYPSAGACVGCGSCCSPVTELSHTPGCVRNYNVPRVERG